MGGNHHLNGRGVLRYLAIDDSKIEPSRQVASNSENQADASSSPVNPPVLAQPSVEQQSQSDAQAQGKEDQYLATDMSGQCTLVKRCRTLSRLRRVIIPTAEQVRVDT